MSNGGKKSQSSTTFHLFAGLTSGFSSSILLQPADLLKTRVQQSGSHSLLLTLRQIASQPQPIRQLWRGTLPSCLRTSIGSALYFTTLNSLRQNLAKRESFSRALVGTPAVTKSPSSSSLPQLTFMGNLSCGAIARASVGFVMMPITVIKVRYESSYYNYTSLFTAARDISSREGARGFFAGFGATAIRDAPYAGLYVVFYEQGKRVLSKLVTTSSTAGSVAAAATSISPAPTTLANLPGNVTPLSPAPVMAPSTSALVNFLSSTLAASTATAITNPPDAIKTRLQLQPAKYHYTLQALKLMLKEEGIRSLFDGLTLRMTRKALSSALAWTVYEEVIRRAEVRWARKGDE